MRAASFALVGMMAVCTTAVASTPTPSETRSGFYTRLGLGIGRATVASWINVPHNNWRAKYRGVGWVLDLVAGGRIGRWLALGGGLFVMEVPAPAVDGAPGLISLPEALSQGRLGMAALGPVVDVFLDARGNAYVGAIGGIGGIGLEDKDGDWSRGWSLGLHAGYDVWVSDAWTVGVSSRYLYTRSTREVAALPATTMPGRIDATARDSASTIGLLFNVACR